MRKELDYTSGIGIGSQNRTVLFTPEGKARTEALLSGLHQTERRAFLSLTEEERAQFIRIGGLLARRLTQQFNSDI